MEDWLSSLKSASIPARARGDSFFIEQHDLFSNHHHWYATSHARPTFCNVCRDVLSGVTSHGLSCEVCKCKVHKRCAAKAIANCKWTTLATVGKDIIEDRDGSIIMPHQWMEGNLPVSSTCSVCKKTCGSFLRLQDWRCLWCRETLHVACRPQIAVACPLGPAKLSVVPPTCVHSIGNDDSWDVESPKGNFSPLLVFVNSKSGDNQGVKFLRRFKQLLNPAQVFDLISTGPSLGLRLFRRFEMFRILVCSGDGSVGWVLSEIDRFSMHKQCQVAVLPLGTGNDLARVLGWGSSCDDDVHLPQILERYESASTKMLDRWSIMVLEKAVGVQPKTPKMSLSSAQEALLTGMVTSANLNLRNIVETDDSQTLITATKTLCETLDKLMVQISESRKDDEQLPVKCDILREKLAMLLEALREEETGAHSGDDLLTKISGIISESAAASPNASTTPSTSASLLNPNISIEKDGKDQFNTNERRNRRSLQSTERESLQCRANSVKRAMYDVIDHSEPGRPKRYQRKLSITPFEALKLPTNASGESIPCSSPTMETSRQTCISPLPDTRRDSVDENFFNAISIPVPRQFADSRRSSGAPEVIQVMEENGQRGNSEIVNPLPMVGENTDISSPSERKIDFLSVPILTSDQIVDPLSDYRPIEVFERSYYMSRELDKEEKLKQSMSANRECNYEDGKEEKTMPEKSNALRFDDEVCQLQLPNVVIPSKAQNVYSSETITIIDTDVATELSSSDELPGGEASDVLSAIGDEECSVASEILDRHQEGQNLDRPLQLGDIIQRPKKRSSLRKPKSAILISQQQLSINASTTTTSATHANGQQTDDELTTKMAIKIEVCDIETYAHMDSGDNLEAPSMPYAQNQPIVATMPHSTLNNQSTITTATTLGSALSTSPKKSGHRQGVKRITFDESCKKESCDDVNPNYPQMRVVVRPPTPLRGHAIKPMNATSATSLLSARMLPMEFRRHSSHETTSLAVREHAEKDGRHSSFNPNFLSLDPDHTKFLSSSPSASRRISCGSLFKPNKALPNLMTFKGSKSSLFMGSALFGFDHFGGGSGDGNSGGDKKRDDKGKKDKECLLGAEDGARKMPIINPPVRLPNWPTLANSSGFISKCLPANADALCAAVSPLMDPVETLLAGYHEKCVMNNYFGIGIDAKISLDFHNKREEHPEKCRSRAKNYMWYGVLGSKQLLQKTCKNLEQRVQLECDGQRIPLPSLQGIVILNIPSFMGGTNFWGSSKKDDIFLLPSFDDRILEVVAVFGSVQMAASRLINLQHHRIAQCQSVQINILGDEEIPIQVDGEAWLQPPGMIRILHKNRVQMLCRNRHLEISLKSWQEKQRQHSISIQREQSSTASEHAMSTDEVLSERECYVLLNFIEAVSSLVKWVKFLIISHPSLQHDLYAVACRAAEVLESIHPDGKLLEGPTLRTKLVEVIESARQLYEDSCNLLRDRAPSLILREDLESKLSVALANIEMELKKCSVQKSFDGKLRAYFNALAPNEEEVYLQST
ncbi:diacylglycerol kinase eta-like [Bactrocera dorsalis]|uniref:Diacylglycerol kinase n=1 Tax=Bactrocera dorsalis TaxID=27457 RepID=A0ABM3J8A7_BACDO|nr:diacylglycerol kinase eta-like [Bactrocera dorsalis]